MLKFVLPPATPPTADGHCGDEEVARPIAEGQVSERLRKSGEEGSRSAVKGKVTRRLHAGSVGVAMSILVLIGVGAVVGVAGLAAMLFLLLSGRDDDNKRRRE